MTTLPAFVPESAQGWGKVRTTQARIARPETIDALKACLRDAAAQGNGVTLRAGGNSYGDLITNTAGVIIDMSAFNRIIDADLTAGAVRVEPGVALGAVADRVLAQGWVPRGVPGSPFVTVGGAIANNIHGKDSFRLGNFGDGVVSMRIMLADGSIVEASRDENAALFDATIGGLGLCGIVVEATLRLERIKSPFLDVELARFDSVDAMIAMFERDAREWDMLVAWMDAFDAEGRGIMEKGRWADAPEDCVAQTALPARDTGAALRRRLGHVCRPFTNRLSMRLLNTLFFRAFPFVRKRSVRHFAAFNFIVTSRIPEPPDLYPGGMVEVQILFPVTAAAASIRDVLRLCRRHRRESWWCGIKLHTGSATPISFTGDGYSFSVNLPGRDIETAAFKAFIDALIDRLAEIGARVYIGKDMVLHADHIARLFPDAPAFMARKRTFDPAGVFDSDLARRLFLK